MTVIDKTAGVESASSPTSFVTTLRPAADVRATELAGLQLTRKDLTDGQLAPAPDAPPGTLGGNTWRIERVEPRPGPQGEASGEYRMFLMDQGA